MEDFDQRKIKILRIINRFNLGGITYNVSYLSAYLPENYDTKLIGGPHEKSETSSLFIPNELGLQPELILEMQRIINPFQDYFAYKKIKRIIKEFKPDIVHTHASKAGFIGRLAAFHTDVPIVIHTFHGHVFSGYFSKFKTLIIKSLERYLAKKSTAIVAISNLQKDEICFVHKVANYSKTVVIPLGFDLRRFTENKVEKRHNFRKHFNLQENEIAVGIIGRLAPIKNHKLFIDAINALSGKTNKKIKALIIGDGETKVALMHYVGDSTIIEFTGWIKEVDVALNGLDIVCLSSNNEGTPVSLIEAQAAGKFIVSTNVGGIQDILHPKCGLLSSINDLTAYTKNLLNAVENFETYQEQAKLASAEVLQKFSYSRLCDDMDKLYKQLLKKSV